MNLTTHLSSPRPRKSSHTRTWPATLTQPVPLYLQRDFACIAHFESTDQNNPVGNGDYGQWGWYQITDETLHSVAHLSGHANAYPKSVQLEAAVEILEMQGWRAWPVSSARCGL